MASPLSEAAEGQPGSAAWRLPDVPEWIVRTQLTQLRRNWLEQRPPRWLFPDWQLSYRWKDFGQGNRRRVLTLEATEFLRRFLLHVLPKRLVRIRYCGLLVNGLLVNRWRVERLKLCRELLGIVSKRELDRSARESAKTAGPATSSVGSLVRKSRGGVYTSKTRTLRSARASGRG